MTIQQQLAALDAAATKGEWSVCLYDCGDTPHYDINGPCPSIQSESEDCAVVHWDGFKQEYWTSANGNQKQIVANAELICALVNAWRSGNLVMVPSVEDLRKIIRDEAVGYCMVPDTIAQAAATAVLTSMGAKTDG